jgi:hypothetical protein
MLHYFEFLKPCENDDELRTILMEIGSYTTTATTPHALGVLLFRLTNYAKGREEILLADLLARIPAVPHIVIAQAIFDDDILRTLTASSQTFAIAALSELRCAAVPSCPNVAARLVKTFPHELAHARELLVDTVELRSREGERVLREYVAMTTPAMPIPAYVISREKSITHLQALMCPLLMALVPDTAINYRHGLCSIFETTPSNDARAAELAVKIVSPQLDLLSIFIAEEPEVLAAFCESGHIPTLRRIMLERSWYDLEEVVTQLLGPLAGEENIEIGIESPCGIFGCRMMTCDCQNDADFDNVQAYDIPLTVLGWFGGACLTCAQHLASPAHALRYPVRGGGFSGCYCSNDCVMQAVFVHEKDDVEYSEVEDKTERAGDMWFKSLDTKTINSKISEEVRENLAYMNGMLKKYGIVERR